MKKQECYYREKYELRKQQTAHITSVQIQIQQSNNNSNSNSLHNISRQSSQIKDTNDCISNQNKKSECESLTEKESFSIEQKVPSKSDDNDNNDILKVNSFETNQLDAKGQNISVSVPFDMCAAYSQILNSLEQSQSQLKQNYNRNNSLHISNEQDDVIKFQLSSSDEKYQKESLNAVLPCLPVNDLWIYNQVQLNQLHACIQNGNEQILDTQIKNNEVKIKLRQNEYNQLQYLIDGEETQGNQQEFNFNREIFESNNKKQCDLLIQQCDELRMKLKQQQTEIILGEFQCSSLEKELTFLQKQDQNVYYYLREQIESTKNNISQQTHLLQQSQQFLDENESSFLELKSPLIKELDLLNEKLDLQQNEQEKHQFQIQSIVDAASNLEEKVQTQQNSNDKHQILAIIQKENPELHSILQGLAVNNDDLDMQVKVQAQMLVALRENKQNKDQENKDQIMKGQKRGVNLRQEQDDLKLNIEVCQQNIQLLKKCSSENRTQIQKLILQNKVDLGQIKKEAEEKYQNVYNQREIDILNKQSMLTQFIIQSEESYGNSSPQITAMFENIQMKSEDLLEKCQVQAIECKSKQQMLQIDFPNELQNLEVEIEKSEQTLMSFHQQFCELQNENNIMSQTNREMQKKIATLNTNLSSSKDHQSGLQSKIEMFKEQIDQLNAKFEQTDVIITKLPKYTFNQLIFNFLLYKIK